MTAETLDDDISYDVDTGTAAHVTPHMVREVTRALTRGDVDEVRMIIMELHNADAADLIEQLATPQRVDLIQLVGLDLDPEIITFLTETVRDDVLHHIDPKGLAAMLPELGSDDALEVIGSFEDEQLEEVLRHVPPVERGWYEEGLGFEEETAGRIMQRDMVAVPSFWTVGQVIDYMRDTEDLPDDFYEVIVVNPRQEPVGVLRLDHLLRTRRPRHLAQIMKRDPVLIPVTMDQEEVAHLFSQYDLVSAAVINEAGQLVGVITVDDVVDIVQEEAEEDMLLMGGVSESDLYASVLDTTRTRFTWLCVNLLTAIVASAVIALFDTAIEKVVALAILMPIVASMGGNAGTQTLTVAVRALATKSLTPSNAVRIVYKEVLVGGLNGICFAVLLGIAGGVWFSDIVLGIILAVAMVINLLIAGFAGTAIPLILDRMGIDPAVSAAVFLTTVTDVVGFFAFLGLGYVFLVP